MIFGTVFDDGACVKAHIVEIVIMVVANSQNKWVCLVFMYTHMREAIIKIE